VNDTTITVLTDIVSLLPGDKRQEILDFAEFMLFKLRTGSDATPAQGRELPEKQRACIRQIAGRSLGAGFHGRDHDCVLYGGSP